MLINASACLLAPCDHMESLGGEFGITWWGEFLLQIFDDVERQTADQSDDAHLPQEHPCGDKRKI